MNFSSNSSKIVKKDYFMKILASIEKYNLEMASIIGLNVYGHKETAFLERIAFDGYNNRPLTIDQNKELDISV